MAVTVSFGMVIVAAVLGGLVFILGSIYSYIYCTRIKPRRRLFHEHRAAYTSHHVDHGAQAQCDQDRPKITVHPIFFMRPFALQKSEGKVVNNWAPHPSPRRT